MKFPGIEPAQAARNSGERDFPRRRGKRVRKRNLILQALIKTGWVKNKAAQLLNLNRTTLIEKIKRQNLQPPNP